MKHRHGPATVTGRRFYWDLFERSCRTSGLPTGNLPGKGRTHKAGSQETCLGCYFVPSVGEAETAEEAS